MVIQGCGCSFNFEENESIRADSHRIKIQLRAVALKNLHTIYCFANLKLTQYIVGFIFSATAPYKNIVNWNLNKNSINYETGC
ncbi:hypothetical protein AB2Z22_001715 [Clostridium botulinum]